jgi:bacterioferritin-associated ferredoxin
MIVCVCAGATKSDIQQLAAAFHTFKAFSEATGISDGCTSCEEHAQEIFNLAREEKEREKIES